MREQRINAIRLRKKSLVFLGIVALASVVMFAWPLFASPGALEGFSSRTPLIIAVLIPMILAVVLAEISEEGFDVKAVAMLGVLSAAVAAVRPLGAGSAGFETVFFVLILGGRVFGPAFGFVLGCTGMFASALLTGGVGPWLPYQMLGAAWVAFGAGLLPQWRGKLEMLVLAAYGAIAALGYGLALNLSFWPFTLGADTELSYVPGAAVVENLHRFIVFSLSTSLGWDIIRALVTIALLLVAAPVVLATLRRAAHKAAFAAPVSFAAPAETEPRTASDVPRQPAGARAPQPSADETPATTPADPPAGT